MQSVFSEMLEEEEKPSSGGCPSIHVPNVVMTDLNRWQKENKGDHEFGGSTWWGELGEYGWGGGIWRRWWFSSKYIVHKYEILKESVKKY